MNIITISREFGSGGREVGKRLADLLGYAYYDKEIEASVAKEMNIDANYIAHSIENGMLINIPLHFGKTIATSYMLKQQFDILAESQRVLKKIATLSNCIIVGRAADIVLSEYKPLKIFVYANMEHKIKRCQQYAEAGENLTCREMERQIKRIDSRRSQYHAMFTEQGWGKKEYYHLCINTTGLEIKKMIPHIAAYAKEWF